MKNIQLKNTSRSFSSNKDGLILFNIFENTIKEKTSILLEIDSEIAMSSSFLNSSFGEVLSLYGLDTLKEYIKIKTSKNQFERISNYISKYSRTHLA
jgi:hypothetical protein